MLSKYLTMTPGEILLPLFSARSFTSYKVASVNGDYSFSLLLLCCLCYYWWSLPLLLPRAQLTTLHLYHCAKTYNAYCFV
ncbi:hypothetical protein ERO13_D06G172725v2 [Gossypium hirsutum]|uniref:Uncharacterized protein n=1 Tax=Gossypium raimondii TaxID=29730 RepID=A0A0D2UFX8_GOSRA|nr:hypothetical protein ERO13_D06G172725v2 [Gossypium hirsutum]KJB67644.1 hypothetical protein B456_010G201700 [Gossypium raimondii]